MGRCNYKRCGPVVSELPVDMSYKYIDEIISKEVIEKVSDNTCIANEISLNPVFDSIKNAKLPIFILGNGIRNCSRTIVEDFIIFLQSKKYIYLSTWGSKDIIEQQAENGMYFGSPGIFGNRKANSLLYFSDCIVSIGCSLGYTHTGYRVSNLNPASLHIIDIDSSQFCNQS